MKAPWRSARFDMPKPKQALQSPKTLHTKKHWSSCRGLEPGYYQRADSPDCTSDGIRHHAQASLAQMKSSTTAASVTMVRGGVRGARIVNYVSINIAIDVVTRQYVAEWQERLRKQQLRLRRVENT